MRRKHRRSLASVGCELLAVLLLSGTAFMWAKTTALAERGYEAIGGEFLFLLLPFMYYAGKRTILDWIAEFREMWGDGGRG